LGFFSLLCFMCVFFFPSSYSWRSLISHTPYFSSFPQPQNPSSTWSKISPVCVWLSSGRCCRSKERNVWAAWRRTTTSVRSRRWGSGEGGSREGRRGGRRDFDWTTTITISKTRKGRNERERIEKAISALLDTGVSIPGDWQETGTVSRCLCVCERERVWCV